MKKIAVIYVLLAGILWGIMGIFVRTLQNVYGFSSLEIVFLRITIAAIAFVLLSLFKGKDALKLKLCDIPLILLMGSCSVVLMALTYFLSMQYSSLAVAAILLYTAPIFVMVSSLFLFKEKLTAIKVLSVTLAFVGFVLVSGITSGKSNVTFMGVLMGLLSAITYASYSVFGKYALKKNDSFKVTTWAFVFASLTTLLFTDCKSVVSTIVCDEKPLLLVLIIVLFGISSAFLPFLFYTKGLSCLPASKASILASVEPLVAAVTGIVVFHEKLTVYIAVGIALIFTSVVLTAKND